MNSLDKAIAAFPIFDESWAKEPYRSRARRYIREAVSGFTGARGSRDAVGQAAESRQVMTCSFYDLNAAECFALVHGKRRFRPRLP